MTLNSVVKAYLAVDELSQAEHSYQLSLALVKLKDMLKTDVEFYMQQEKKLIKQYALIDDNGNIKLTDKNRFIFRDAGDAPKYAQERQVLENTQTTIDNLPISAPPPEKIKPALLTALEGFISFEEADKT